MRQVTVAVATAADVGESPVWDAAAQLLHWVDIAPGLIHRTDVGSGTTQTIKLPTMVGAVALHRSGGYLAATTQGFLRVEADGASAVVADVLPAGHRMNDAKCDPIGRMWAGSVELEFTPGAGALHVLDGHGRHRITLDGLTLPNGLDWSPDGHTFYLVDSMVGTIDAYDFDLPTGAVTNRQTIVTYDGESGQPDGLAVDVDGCLWVAMWGGGAIERRSPTGRLLDRIALPVAQPTSCAFGGPRLDTLYVTSARRGLDPPSGSADGSVLAVTGLGTRGRLPVSYGAA